MRKDRLQVPMICISLSYVASVIAGISHNEGTIVATFISFVVCFYWMARRIYEL